MVVPIQELPTQNESTARCTYREVKDPLKLYQGKDCAEVFCKYIESEAKRLYHMFPEMLMKCLTKEEWREFRGCD